MVIEKAARSDLPEVRTLLECHHLPADGIDELAETLLVARDDARVVGAAGVELYADGALLRSVAVDPAVQGQRLGQQLIEAALRMAEARGAHAVFLLTTTADRFFARFGFEEITRADVPTSVQSSVEFRFACCESAVVMRKRMSAAG
jgi:amino-acid N-acetyltransferase